MYNGVMNRKTLKTTLSFAAILVMVIIAIPLLGGCRRNNTTTFTHLAEGTYTLRATYVNGVQQHSGLYFNAVAGISFRVEGQYVFATMPLVNWYNVQFRHRINNGYLEQQEMRPGAPWVRENGSAASEYASTRVENGEIVMRHTAPGQPVWVTFFSLGTPDTETPPQDPGDII